MHRRLALGTIAATAALTLVAACGSSSSGNGGGGGGSNNSSVPPKTELTSALHSLTAGSALTTTLSLSTTAANLLKIGSEGGSSSLTPAQAALIASARIVVSDVAPSGKTLAQAATAPAAQQGSAVSLTGTAGGTTYFSFVEVNKALYLQVDLKDLLGAAGQSSEYETLVTRTATLPAFVQAFIAGKYVSLPFSTISSISSLIKGTEPGKIPANSQLMGLVRQVETAVLADLSVSRTSSGSTDQLAISANVHDIATDVLSAVSTAIPAAAAEVSPGQADAVPNKTINFTASVTGGALSKLSFDFGQFSPHQKDTLPVQATFVKSAPSIAAPSGAVPVNLQTLIQLFTAVGGASTSSGSGSVVPQAATSPAAASSK